MTGDQEGPSPERGRIKCVVWDLDDTLWRGVLLEDPKVVVDERVLQTLHTLDERGILNSVASRNDHDTAMSRIADAGLGTQFLYPQISWGPKSESVAQVARSLNLGLDSLAFVDDQPFELAEVAFAHPEVLTIPVQDVHAAVATRPEFLPRFITDESRRRRQLYLADAARKAEEAEFVGTSEEFLATLNMSFRIWPARGEDVRRAEDLTVRTHQLNSTGRTYSYEELQELRARDDHMLLMSSLDDRFGSYGTIGLALVECQPREWRLRLLLMSCRVVSRGVGTVMLNHVIRLAHRAGATLYGEFVDNGRNRMMYVTYKFLGFEEVSRNGDHAVLALPARYAAPRTDPPYLRLELS
ncbi:HAD-IIIC family phosphatase [Paractinoplanes rhizophilus]|uniref:HAD-IIIC family phosphatase n=1 Tax=Paractinoplanes rhizophilus TaxID=1416877 RepID=A0ABW2I0M1_9ACTN